MHCIEIAEKIGRTTFGKPQACRNLTVVPLIEHGTPAEPPLTLDEALAAGVAEVTEVSAAGHVPELRFRNAGDRPVLLLDGEELVGAKQNRALNLTILAPAGSEIVIPVSCVEQGRWHRRSERFASSNRTLYATLRQQKMRQVSENLRGKAGARSDQAAIWDDIAEKSQRMASRSDTHAAAAMYEQHGADLDELVRALRPVGGQAGAVFFVGGRLAGAELLASPALFAKLADKLTRGYALDAIDAEGPADERGAGDGEGPPAAPAAEPDAARFLAAVAHAAAERHQAVGLGEDVRLQVPTAIAAALVADRQVVHLSAFASDTR